MAVSEDIIRQRLTPREWRHLDERGRRLTAARVAREYGRGAVGLVSKVTGMARSTIARGLKELEENPPLKSGRIRKPGAGRKRKYVWDSRLRRDLKRLVEPHQLRAVDWTTKTLRPLSKSLNAQGHSVSPHMVADCLRSLGYHLQSNQRTPELGGRIDRDAQFRYVNEQAAAFLDTGAPVFAVDTKMEEWPGEIRNGAGRSKPRNDSAPVGRCLDSKLDKAFPCGIDTLVSDKGWVTVGMEHDTASFAVHAIRRWWQAAGQIRYPGATRLMIVTDAARSNGHRVPLWKLELQTLANELRLPVTVCHLPPATMKWSNIEYRLLSYVPLGVGPGRTPRSFRTIVHSIAASSVTTEPKVSLELDENTYPKAVKVTDVERRAVTISPHSFQGLWNYTIIPT